jgi:1,2-diacylglycerol 3-beta-glucosyltransferase
MILLSIVVALVAAVLLLPSVSDLVSVMRVPARPRAEPPIERAPAPRLFLLVPAHDEELVVGACLESIRRLSYPPTALDAVVIADNCRDRTPGVARAAGVRCLVRVAPEDPGKPRAIAWALSQVALSQYDAVVIVDADTELDPDFATHLAAAAPLGAKALQPYNGVLNSTENALTRMASVLGFADHALAYTLKTRAGLNVPLSAGMCVGSRLLERFGWSVFSLSEDWELYALLTTHGVTIQGVPQARLYAEEASTLGASTSQRRRWAAGKFTVLARYAWPLLRSRNIGFAQKLDAIAELSRPGPVVHLGLVTGASAGVLALHQPGAGALVVVLLATLLRPALYTTIAIWRGPDPLHAIGAFAFLPVYAVWRTWTALTTLCTLGDKAWVRTARQRRSALPQP